VTCGRRKALLDKTSRVFSALTLCVAVRQNLIHNEWNVIMLIWIIGQADMASGRLAGDKDTVSRSGDINVGLLLSTTSLVTDSVTSTLVEWLSACIGVSSPSPSSIGQSANYQHRSSRSQGHSNAHLDWPPYRRLDQEVVWS
jgi:hypothetical protein